MQFDRRLQAGADFHDSQLMLSSARARAVTSGSLKVRFTDRRKAKKNQNTLLLNVRSGTCERVTETVVFERTVPPQGPIRSHMIFISQWSSNVFQVGWKAEVQSSCSCH